MVPVSLNWMELTKACTAALLAALPLRLMVSACPGAPVAPLAMTPICVPLYDTVDPATAPEVVMPPRAPMLNLSWLASAAAPLMATVSLPLFQVPVSLK